MNLARVPGEVSAAVRSGDLAELKRLFDSHPDYVKASSPIVGGTWLHFAAQHGQVSIIDYLVSLGFDVDVHDADGGTPLVIAAEAGHYEAVELLTALGANLEGHAPLSNPLFAAIRGSVQGNATQPRSTDRAPRSSTFCLDTERMRKPATIRPR